MKKILKGIVHYFLNHIVSHIPFWIVRKFFYKVSGMKIGKKSRILMGLHVVNPWGIKVGNSSYINANCYLDGRGGLIIGDNVNISIYSKILTGSHESSSSNFEYFSKPVTIDSYVWTGIGSIILPGSHLPKGMILGAGSLAIENKVGYQENGIYSGVPAKKIGDRGVALDFNQGGWKPFME